jgi:hypothetical protein
MDLDFSCSYILLYNNKYKRMSRNNRNIDTLSNREMNTVLDAHDELLLIARHKLNLSHTNNLFAVIPFLSHTSYILRYGLDTKHNTQHKTKQKEQTKHKITKRTKRTKRRKKRTPLFFVLCVTDMLILLRKI